MTITIRVTELELDLLKKKKEQTGKNTTEILKSAIYFTGVDETFVDNLIITTLIISKKPGNTGFSRDIRTEFTTDLLLSD